MCADVKAVTAVRPPPAGADTAGATPTAGAAAPLAAPLEASLEAQIARALAHHPEKELVLGLLRLAAADVPVAERLEIGLRMARTGHLLASVRVVSGLLVRALRT